jgi:uncharacterized protein YdcH (DUF465 family)
MSVEKHDLVHELPEYRERIHELKTSNRHFASLFVQYHDTNQAVLRAEAGIETPADDYLESLKRQRLALKDELYAMLREAG